MDEGLRSVVLHIDWPVPSPDMSTLKTVTEIFGQRV